MEVEFFQLTKAGAREVWDTLFAEHHYMSEKLRASVAYVGILDGQPVVFVSCIFTPSSKKIYPPGGFYSEHRTVVLPDYQGMGIGVRASEWLGDVVLASGYRYYSKTAHPAMGAYRNSSPLWKASSKNLQIRKATWNSGGKGRDGIRGPLPRFSHEYLGDLTN